MILAAAQTVPTHGNIEQNLLDHCRLAQLAAAQNAQLIIFPELSITGYVLEDARRLAFSYNDERLESLRHISTKDNITIIAGAPLLHNNKVYLAAFILLPDGTHSVYTKQFLHEGEEKFYVGGSEFNPQIKIGDEVCSIAICADITNPLHPANAAMAKSTLYLAGIFYSPKGITEGHGNLQDYATTHSLNVLMANYGGPSNNSPSAGRSAFWSNTGERIAELPDSGEGLLLVQKDKDGWKALE